MGRNLVATRGLEVEMWCPSIIATVKNWNPKNPERNSRKKKMKIKKKIRGMLRDSEGNHRLRINPGAWARGHLKYISVPNQKESDRRLCG